MHAVFIACWLNKWRLSVGHCGFLWPALSRKRASSATENAIFFPNRRHREWFASKPRESKRCNEFKQGPSGRWDV